METTCILCGLIFTSRHSYGICSLCSSADRLREFDRLESSIRSAQRASLPVTLTLIEWLATLSDFEGKCAFCDEYQAGVIEMVESLRGLTYDNVVPACRACHARRKEGYASAEERVREYLQSDRMQDVQPDG